MHVEKNLFMFSWAREKALTTNGLAEVTLPALPALTHRSSKVELVGKGSRVRYGTGGALVPCMEASEDVNSQILICA